MLRYCLPKDGHGVSTNWVFIVVLVALSFTLQTQEGGQLFTYIQKVGSYFQPPIAACFILAMFWKRTSERGAFWGLVSGITIGVLRMILDFTYPMPPCGQGDLRPSIVKDVHYLHFTVILTVITTIIIVILSLLSPPISDAEVGGLTWWTRFDPLCIVSKKTEKSALVADDEVAKQYNDNIPPETGQNQQEDVGEFDLGHPSTRFELPVESVSYHGKDEVVLKQNNEHADGRTPKSEPLWKKILLFISGMDGSKTTRLEVSEAPTIQSIHEDPFWNRVVNYNLVVCVVVAVALWIIFR